MLFLKFLITYVFDKINKDLNYKTGDRIYVGYDFGAFDKLY